MIYKKPKLIAEAGCNHKGNFEIAKKLIETAKNFCEVDVIKFQKRNPIELLSQKQYRSQHPNPANSYGKTYGEHREFLEFTKNQHKKLKEYCDEIGIEYSSSVWDLTSAKELVAINPKMIKIGSPSNLRFDMLGYLCDEYGGEIHLSLGMTIHDEEEKIIKFFEKKKRNKDLVIYSCTSGYPVPFEDVALLEIKRIKRKFGDIIKDIGFSGHHLGIAIDPVAYALGANYIERHFTLDRTWKGTDHSASLEPDGLRRLARNLYTSHTALRYKNKEILDIEQEQRKKLKNYI